MTEHRRWSPVQTLTGVVVGMLIAGVLVPLAVGSRGGSSVAGSGAQSNAVGPLGDGGAPGSGTATGTSASASTIAGGLRGTVGGAASGAQGSAPAAGNGTAATTTNSSPVKLGFTLFDVGGASKLGFPIGADPAQEKEAYQALVTYLNGTGGLHGRSIVPVWSTYDLINADSQQQSCLALTQDAHVFAVIGGFNYPAASLCVVDSNRTLLFNNNAFSLDELYQSGRHVSIFAKSSRMMATFARRMAEQGQISGKRVGILDDLGGDPTKSVINALAGAVRANGGNVVREGVLSADLSSGSSQIPVEVGQMRAAGVQVVLFLASPLFGTQFVQEANSQGWTPVYAGSDWDVWYTDVGAQNMPSSFAGSYSVTTVRTGEEKVGLPENPQAVQCRSIFEQATHKQAPVRGSDFFGLIMQTCDTMLTFAAAARAADPTLDQATFIAAAQRLGPIEEAAWGGGSFGPGKLDLNDRTRIIRWAADCKCWKPATQFESG